MNKMHTQKQIKTVVVTYVCYVHKCACTYVACAYAMYVEWKENDTINLKVAGP